MDLTKPMAVTKNFNVDSFVKDIMNKKAFEHQKLVKFFRLKERKKKVRVKKEN